MPVHMAAVIAYVVVELLELAANAVFARFMLLTVRNDDEHNNCFNKIGRSIDSIGFRGMRAACLRERGRRRVLSLHDALRADGDAAIAAQNGWLFGRATHGLLKRRVFE